MLAEAGLFIQNVDFYIEGELKWPLAGGNRCTRGESCACCTPHACEAAHGLVSVLKCQAV